jgi:hypothetical protein
MAWIEFARNDIFIILKLLDIRLSTPGDHAAIDLTDIKHKVLRQSAASGADRVAAFSTLPAMTSFAWARAVCRLPDGRNGGNKPSNRCNCADFRLFARRVRRGGGGKMALRPIAALALIVAAGLQGCASVQAPQTEGLLAGAGFVRLQADTPQKLAKLQALPQNQITFAQRKKGNAYLYADAAGCNCVFVGNAAAFQLYQQMLAANNIAQMQQQTAMLNAEAAEDWGGAWGPMVPYWY